MKVTSQNKLSYKLGVVQLIAGEKPISLKDVAAYDTETKEVTIYKRNENNHLSKVIEWKSPNKKLVIETETKIVNDTQLVWKNNRVIDGIVETVFTVLDEKDLKEIEANEPTSIKEPEPQNTVTGTVL